MEKAGGGQWARAGALKTMKGRGGSLILGLSERAFLCPLLLLCNTSMGTAAPLPLW